jgi:hypothetical protein
MKRGLGFVCCAAVLVGLISAPARAATVKVGSALTGTYVSVNFNADATGMTSSINGATAASPVSGTVVSWTLKGATGGPLFLQIVRPSAPNLFASIKSSAGVIASTQPNPTSLPIQAGDLLGVRNTNGGDQLGFMTAPASVAQIFIPSLADGGASASPLGGVAGEYGIQADVRYCIAPRVRGLKLAKAKKRLAAADCAFKIRGKGKKKGKAKSVRSQKVAPGTSISDTQPIGLKLGKKSKAKKN